MTHPLTAFRRSRKLSLEAFGALVGASKSMVWKWEHGKAVPRPRYAQRIYAITKAKVTPNDFVLGTELRAA